MNVSLKILASVVSATILLTAGLMTAETSEKDGRVTRIIRDVRILPTEADARPAVIDDKVQEGAAVRTGDESRSELTFGDLTITRLGANTVYSFDKAGRNVRLESGTILLRVPKNSGGAQMTTTAVTVAVTGTTVIFGFNEEAQSGLVVLEGGARISLNKHPGESARVRAGQRLDVGAGATKLPQPVKVDLEEIMRTSPLITDFPPLPSQDLILAAIRDQNSQPDQPSHTTHKSSPPPPSGSGSTQQAGPAVYPSQPANTGGPPLPPFWPTGLGRIDPNWPGGTSHRTHPTKDNYPKKSGDGEPGHGKTGQGKTGQGETGQVPSRYRPTPTPTPAKQPAKRLPARTRPKPTPSGQRTY
jgi:FecR protein